VPSSVGFALALLIAGSVPQPEIAGLQLRFSGNLVLPDEVYRTVLDLPEWASATPDQAQQIEQQLYTFLHRAGYELAEVHAAVDGDGIAVRINEGRLEKVVFRGRLTVQTVAFKLALSIPHEVFNRPALERSMAQLVEELGLDRAWFELVPTAKVAHRGPQLESLPAIKGFQLISSRQPFELHVFFAEKAWDVGFGLDLRSGYSDGLEAGANYQGEGLLFAGDRWRTALSGGAGLRRRVGDDQFYLAFSRAYADVRYYGPELRWKLRPLLWLEGDLISRQRRDLKLENYYAAMADASLLLDFQPLPELRLALGGGIDARRIFGYQMAADTPLAPSLVEIRRLRPFGMFRGELVLDGGAERADRRHALTAELKHQIGAEATTPGFGHAGFRYQLVVPFGWHDLWIKGRGKWLWGEVAIHNEEPLGEYLHGVFGEEFVRRIAGGSAEFRFSITRDLFKLSVFHETAIWEELDRETGGAPRRQAANSVGAGLHTLIEGMFQLDFYFAFGFRTGERYDAAVSALLLKVF
jgi:hypothetical protein